MLGTWEAITDMSPTVCILVILGIAPTWRSRADHKYSCKYPNHNSNHSYHTYTNHGSPSRKFFKIALCISIQAYVPSRLLCRSPGFSGNPRGTVLQAPKSWNMDVGRYMLVLLLFFARGWRTVMFKNVCLALYVMVAQFHIN